MANWDQRGPLALGPGPRTQGDRQRTMNETAKRTMTETATRTMNETAKTAMNETAKRAMNENANIQRMKTQIPNELMVFNGQLGPGPLFQAQGPEHREIDKEQ